MGQICQNCHEEWVSMFGFGCAEVVQWSHPLWVFTPLWVLSRTEESGTFWPSITQPRGGCGRCGLVPDAQLAPNEVGVRPDVHAECRSDDGVAAPQEIPLTQNHPRKWRSNTFTFVILPSFYSFVSILSIFVFYMQETILIMMVVLLFLHQPTWTQGLWPLTV